MKRIWSISTLVVLFGASGIAADDGDRDKLVGSWVSQNEPGNGAASAWTIEKKGDAFQITEVEGTEKVADYPCKADGQECEVKTSGKKVKISMWFNGPKLVQLETQGNSVIKRRFGVLPQDDTLELEIIPITPSGKTEMIHFKRAPLSAKSK